MKSSLTPTEVNVIIMAGGKGTRLAGVEPNTPKSLVKIGNKPIIYHLVDHLASFGITSIYISVGHLKSDVINNVGGGEKWGIEIKYIQEEFPLGSIGVLRQYDDWKFSKFLVINGDILTNFDLFTFFSTIDLDFTDMAVLTVKREIEIQYGVLKTNEERDIISFEEKPTWELVINSGIYFFTRKVLNLIPKHTKVEGWELVKMAINSSFKVVEVPLENGYWIDIGTPETLKEAQELLRYDAPYIPEAEQV